MNDATPRNDAALLPQYCTEPPRDDEISLVDLMLVLYSHKLAIAVTTLLSLALAFTVYLSAPDTTTYATSIRIGGSPAIESNGNTMARLNELHIPMVRNSLEPQSPLNGLPLVIRAPANSDLVIVESSAGDGTQAHVEALHRRVADALIGDHQRRLDSTRRAINNQIERMQRMQENLRNSTHLVTLRNEVESLRRRYLDSAGMADTMRNALRDELRFLQTKLIEEEQRVTSQTLELDTSISQLRFQLDEMPHTEIVALALTSGRTERSWLSHIAVGLLLGLLLGLLVALMLELLGKVRRELRARSRQPD